MKKHILLPLLLLLFSCNTPNKKELSEQERLAIKKQQADSLMLVFDSLMQVKIDVPQLIDSSFVSVDCLNTFHKLARETQGSLKVLSNSKLVTKTIIDIIRNNSSDNSDLMILIDKTSSMEDDLDDIKKGLDQLLNTIKQYKNIRLAVGTYGDKNVDGKLWYDFRNFENDYKETSSFINHIELTGGGDFPESVYDGIYRAFQENFWRSDSKRMVILIGDAPSLDSSKTEHSIEEVISIAKKEKINMNFYPIVLSPYGGDGTIDTGPRMEKMNFIMNLYPNPTGGPLALQLVNETELTIELIDQKGAILKTMLSSGDHEKMELGDMPNGIYIIRAYDKFKNFDERKLIINK